MGLNVKVLADAPVGCVVPDPVGQVGGVVLGVGAVLVDAEGSTPDGSAASANTNAGWMAIVSIITTPRLSPNFLIVILIAARVMLLSLFLPPHFVSRVACGVRGEPS